MAMLLSAHFPLLMADLQLVPAMYETPTRVVGRALGDTAPSVQPGHPSTTTHRNKNKFIADL
jgi:hypothetical protein